MAAISVRLIEHLCHGHVTLTKLGPAIAWHDKRNKCKWFQQLLLRRGLPQHLTWWTIGSEPNWDTDVKVSTCPLACMIPACIANSEADLE